MLRVQTFMHEDQSAEVARGAHKRDGGRADGKRRVWEVHGRHVVLVSRPLCLGGNGVLGSRLS